MQSSVLKLVVKRMGQNLVKGKSIMNTSLPIQIFDEISFLERLCIGFTYGPIFLEKAAKLTSPVERFKLNMAFSIGAYLTFMQMQKAFNPILGETYQGLIDGCPCYAQQISHHPPISSILFLGRGYKMFGNLEATVHIHMNSADGLNIGWYHVVFDDGQQICFQTPPA